MAVSKIPCSGHGLDTARKETIASFPFVCPCDGYIQIYGSGSASVTGSIIIDGVSILAFPSNPYSAIVPVKAGQTVLISNMASIYWKNFFPYK